VKRVVNVVRMWKSRFCTGTLYAKTPKAKLESNIIAKTNQRVFTPTASTFSTVGRAGIHVAVEVWVAEWVCVCVCEDEAVCVGIRRDEVLNPRIKSNIMG